MSFMISFCIPKFFRGALYERRRENTRTHFNTNFNFIEDKKNVWTLEMALD